MIKEIQVKPNTFESEILLFKKVKLKRINILFGGNGVGKTTFLKGIKNNNFDVVKSDEYEVIMYQNSQDNYRQNNPSELAKDFGYQSLQRMIATQMSEGQSIIFSFTNFLEYIKKKCKNNNKSIIVLIDEIDSGLSAENINMMIHLILDMYNNYENIQFIISSNAYHFTYVFKKVLSIHNGEWIQINSYDEFFQKLSSEMVDLGKKRNLKFLAISKYKNMELESREMRIGCNVQLNDAALYMPCSPFIPMTTSLTFANEKKISH